MLALAENGDAVGDGKHLVQLVCNNNNRFALVAHTTENVKQLFRLLRGKHGGGLIKNKYVRTAVEYLQYLYRLLLGNAHIVDLLVGIHYKAVFLGKRDYLLSRGGKRIFVLIYAEDDILGRRKYIDELEMLMYHSDLVTERIFRGADNDGFSVDINLSLVGIVNTRYHIHKSGLAAAVFAEYRKYLAVKHVKVNILICNYAAKSLGNML